MFKIMGYYQRYNFIVIYILLRQRNPTNSNILVGFFLNL